MGKTLLLILLAIAAFLIYKSVKRAGAARGGAGGATRKSSGARRMPERMLACARCGLVLPESEGVRTGEAFFCSEEHRRLGS